MTKSSHLTLGDWTFELITEHKLPADTTKATLDYLAAHQDAIRAAIIPAIKAEYDKALADSDAFDPEDLPEILPPVHSDADLLELVEPRSANIFQTTKAGHHYIGLEFECTWDDEHGLGVMIHQSKAVRHGGGDVAFLEWMAEDAAKK